LINQGENPLVVNDVITSCGCISVNYPKKPILPKETLLITITYKAEKPEYINKVLTVYANTKTPLRLTVNGSAK
jgi:hypothetical protein